MIQEILMKRNSFFLFGVKNTRKARLLIGVIFITLIIVNLTVQAQTDSLRPGIDPVDTVQIQDSTEKSAAVEMQIADTSKTQTAIPEPAKTKPAMTGPARPPAASRQTAKSRITKPATITESTEIEFKGYPVMGIRGDTLFLIYSKVGVVSPQERAVNITRRIEKLYDEDFLKIDSILIILEEKSYDIVYGDKIIMSVSQTEAAFYEKSAEQLSRDFKQKIQDSLTDAKKGKRWLILLLRIGLVLLVVAIARLVIWLIDKGHVRLLNFVKQNKNKWCKNLSYKDYTFVTAKQEYQILLSLVKALRWVVYALLLYIMLPIIFSIFPFSRTWANALFQLIWSPFKAVLIAVWEYLPSLIRILVIIFVMKYFIRFVKYIFAEIQAGKLKIAGFHTDWAMPTYSIVKFLLMAFTLVMIFPLLPGSDSGIFRGVSVFIGILFSLGSSSAISNMVAGLVITYMRPFKIGDRIKIGEISGDVIEKTLLVTRVKTIKNEIITIPNASVLSFNTTNYSSEAVDEGLIVHTTVTIGYDVPWKDVHKALIEAAQRTDLILRKPKPFVLQTSLDDFYVSYQINAYTKEANKQAVTYSNLHQNIQDVCNEMGIEIMSPHYRANRDGNTTAIPTKYLPKKYRAGGFKVEIKKDDEN